MPSKVWDEIIYPFQNIKGAIVVYMFTGSYTKQLVPGNEIFTRRY